MVIGGLLKFSIGLVGLSIAILILVWGLIKKDNRKIKRAAMVFIATWVLLLLIALIELMRAL